GRNLRVRRARRAAPLRGKAHRSRRRRASRPLARQDGGWRAICIVTARRAAARLLDHGGTMAEENKRTILVTGATGHQGGTLARVLLERGHKVRAFTRFPTSEGARRVERLGAEIYRGDFEDLP